jgi:site-specific DNA-methyltransferase (cytosine-N4-specific)
MFCGASDEVLTHDPLVRWKGKVQLVFTSPPFPLNRKKRYGNLNGQKYVDWLSGFSGLLKEYLTPDGSIVLELGNAWEEGKPTMSTLPLKALLAFQEQGDLHLCQEFICFNPARLPSPAQWVTVERSRVKDAFTRVWWMSPSPKPKADNRRVLTEYSDAMKKLLKKGTYNPGTRPSQHCIGETSFLTDNAGAITPNVLVPACEEMLPELLEVLTISNTRADDPYQVHCRANGITPHPARMPMKLVEFFVRFLTEEGDMVLDPFAGSNSTGFVAEELKRKWRAIEVNAEYAAHSRARFGKRRKASKQK